VRVVRRAP